jgi:hypothetical protein
MNVRATVVSMSLRVTTNICDPNGSKLSFNFLQSESFTHSALCSAQWVVVRWTISKLEIHLRKTITYGSQLALSNTVCSVKGHF